MRKMLLPVPVLLSVLAAAAPVFAAETGTTASLVGTNLPGEKGGARESVDGDDLVKKHCTGCHTEQRIMIALQSMHSEQSENYEKQLKSIIIRKIRLTNGNISRQDGRKIIDYLINVWQQQKPLTTLSVSVDTGSAPLDKQLLGR